MLGMTILLPLRNEYRYLPGLCMSLFELHKLGGLLYCSSLSAIRTMNKIRQHFKEMQVLWQYSGHPYFRLSSHTKMMRCKGANTVELEGFLLNLDLKLAVLSFPLSSLLCLLLKDPGCWIICSVGANLSFWKQRYFEQVLLFPAMLIWHSGGKRHNGYGTMKIVILVSEWAFPQSVPTLLNRGSWQCCLSFQTQVVQLHTQHWYIQLPPTPLIPDTQRPFSFFF